MSYKQAQAAGRAALKQFRVRWDGATLNLGIKKYKRLYSPRGGVVKQLKADAWAVADQLMERANKAKAESK